MRPAVGMHWSEHSVLRHTTLFAREIPEGIHWGCTKALVLACLLLSAQDQCTSDFLDSFARHYFTNSLCISIAKWAAGSVTMIAVRHQKLLCMLERLDQCYRGQGMMQAAWNDP